MTDYLSFHKPNIYTISEIGRREFIRRRAANTNGVVSSIGWKDIELGAILVSKGNYDPDNETYIGHVDGLDCVLPLKSTDRIGSDSRNEQFRPRPTGAQLTRCYLEVFGDMMGLSEEESTWQRLKRTIKVIGINNKIYVDGTDLRLVERLLHYCGIKVKHKEAHSRLLNVIDSFYIVSDKPLEAIIKRHRETSSYKFDDIFYVKDDKIRVKNDSMLSRPAAERLLLLKKRNKIVAVEDFNKALSSNTFLDLGRIFNYCYNIAEIMKVTTEGPKNAVQEFVTQLPFWDILQYPFVDKNRTTCNNWNSMMITVGVGAAYNWHLYELTTFLGGCGEHSDKRHLVGLSDFIWEKGRPSGVNLYGIQKHGFGVMTTMSFEGAGKQLWSSFYKKPESVTNFAVSGLTGTEPVGNKAMAMKLIAAREREAEEKRARLAIRLGNKYSKTDDSLTVNEATNDDAMSIEAMSILMRQNPEQSIETFTIDKALVPEVPDDIEVTDKYYHTYVFKSIQTESLRALNMLRGLIPYEDEKPEITILPANSGFFDIDKLFELVQNLNTDDIESEEENSESLSDDLFAEGASGEELDSSDDN